MKDERRKCGACKHEHAYGILRYSQDNVPLYGARRCDVTFPIVENIRHQDDGDRIEWKKCNCDRFVEAVEGMENLPSLTQPETKALWEATSFLNAQVPMATRIAVRQISDLLDLSIPTEGTNNFLAPIKPVLKEFAGLMISQLTDIRGAMTRDENKFAHLVAHTDEIVESMRAVTQLAERLTNLTMAVERVHERLDKLAGEKEEVCGCGQRIDQHSEKRGSLCGPIAPTQAELRAVFDHKSAPLWNEAIVTDPLDGGSLTPEESKIIYGLVDETAKFEERRKAALKEWGKQIVDRGLRNQIIADEPPED